MCLWLVVVWSVQGAAPPLSGGNGTAQEMRRDMQTYNEILYFF